MQKEIDFTQEYQTKVILTKCCFLEKVYSLYLNQAYKLFTIEANGKINHRNLFLDSGCPVLTDYPHRFYIEQMFQDYICLQYESIQRICNLTCSDGNTPVSSYTWKGRSSFLMEIGNSLLISGNVIPIGAKTNKNNWFKALFHFLHLEEPRYIDQTLYKLNNRENPVRFLSELLLNYQQWLAEEN